MAGDGQVTLGNQIIKAGARKVRRLYKGSVLAGFAGSTADAMTPRERFESRLEENSGDLMRSAVAMVKERARQGAPQAGSDDDRRGREALAASFRAGDILEPENNIASIAPDRGSRRPPGIALLETSDWAPSKIAKRSIEIASEICIYTDSIVTVEAIGE